MNEYLTRRRLDQGRLRRQPPAAAMPLPHQPFDAAAHESHFAGPIAAKVARLAPADRAFIDHVLAQTLNRNVVLARVRDYFLSKQSGGDHAG